MNKSPEVKTIIYATDLGGQTRPVVRHALAMARLYGARVIMVHVVEPMSEAARSVVMAYLSQDVTKDVQKKAMEDTLALMKERIKTFYLEEHYEGKDSKLVKEAVVVSGKPSEEILRVCEELKGDMIVMGKSSRKVRGIRVMGSTARRVSRMSMVPVLIVPNY